MESELRRAAEKPGSSGGVWVWEMESAASQVTPRTGISLPQQSTAGIEPRVFEGKRRSCFLHRIPPYANTQVQGIFFPHNRKKYHKRLIAQQAYN